MDAVISIGGQSFLDGVLRLLDPALQALRVPMPVALPGLTNGLLTIRNIEPVLPSRSPGRIELRIELELAGELLLVASVAAGTVNLSLGEGVITLDTTRGKVPQPERTGTFETKATPMAGTVGPGTLGAAPLDLNKLEGVLKLPAASDLTLNLDGITGKLKLPVGVGNLALPLPAAVPVAVDLTRAAPLVATIFLGVNLNGAAVGNYAPIDASTGFSLEFGFDVYKVLPPALDVPPVPPGTFATTLGGAITSAITSVVDQLLGGPGPIKQPSLDAGAVANAIAAAIPAAVESTLSDAFTGLKGRTARLLYPRPGPGASCDVRALPTVAKAKLEVAADGSFFVQVGFDRTSVSRPTDTFSAIPPTTPLVPIVPTPTPASPTDTRVTIDNRFVLRLMACLLEKLPNLTLPPGGPVMSAAGTTLSARWDPVALTLGRLTLRGTLTLTIAGTPAASGTAPVPKSISLSFDLGDIINVPWVGRTLDVRLRFTLPVAFDLNNLASITSLRLAAPPVIAECTFTAGTALTVWLVALAFGTFMPGLVGLIAVGPHVILYVIQSLLRNTIDQVLGNARLIESPAALPPGIFDALGELVPTTLVVDDLVAEGVLDTPTSPWSVLPISITKRLAPPPPGQSG